MILQVLCYLVLLGVIACSDEGETVIRKKPRPTPTAISWDEAQPIVDDKCGGCHNGSQQKKIDSKARLVASKGRIADGSMPPGGGLDDETKAKLLGVQ